MRRLAGVNLRTLTLMLLPYDRFRRVLHVELNATLGELSVCLNFIFLSFVRVYRILPGSQDSARGNSMMHAAG